MLGKKAVATENRTVEESLARGLWGVRLLIPQPCKAVHKFYVHYQSFVRALLTGTCVF